MEEILPVVESYVFVEHSNKPVITISGRPVVTGSHEDFKDGIDILRDISIHVDFSVPPADVDDSTDTSTEEVMDNFTSELKKARLEYKLAKTTLIRKFILCCLYSALHLSQLMRLWCLSHRRPAKTQTSSPHWMAAHACLKNECMEDK